MWGNYSVSPKTAARMSKSKGKGHRRHNRKGDKAVHQGTEHWKCGLQGQVQREPKPSLWSPHTQSMVP